MATIKPFCSIRINPSQPHQISYTSPKTSSVSLGIAPDDLPLKIALETVARQRPETIERQAVAFQEIRESLESFLDMEFLLLDERPGIFIYEVAGPNKTQTGIWALTDLKDYTTGQILVHEHTFGESVRRLHHYRRATGLEGSPVLLTYRPDETINRIISETKNRAPDLSLETHCLWKIEDDYVILDIVKAFEKIGKVYLADGHHRLNSAANLSIEQKLSGARPNSMHTSLYMAADQLQISGYHRVVLPDQPLDKAKLFGELNKHFYLIESYMNRPVQPVKPHTIGLFIDGDWFRLTVKPSTFIQQQGSDCLDAAILQCKVIAPVFGIADPQSDSRLKYFGGPHAMEEILQLSSEQSAAIAFTLCPLSTGELMNVADAGDILPPKSTWINPKVPYGLLLYQFQPNE